MRTGFPDESARIADLRTPTLVLWGGLDRLIDPADAQRFAEDIPGSRLVIYDDLGHIPMEEDATRTVKDVERFLADLGP
jgi:pimeloyl-ACP methyl ester carboxylesterase